MKIGFIGAGKMGEAILKGFIKQNIVPKKNIFIRNSCDKSTKIVTERNNVNSCENIYDLVNNSDLVIIGVKPYLIADILEKIKDTVAEKIIISMAAAVSISDMENIIPDKKIIRIMPNTPVEVCSGVIGMCANTFITPEEKTTIHTIFSALGICIEIKESDMSSLTAISGSGPAYAYLFVEALADGAVLNGLKRDISYKLAAQTLLGSAKMLLETCHHPAKLKDDVTSPAGSTIEAIRILEEKGFRSAVIECERACFEKLKNM
ncbi:pyrroline-5-carboxylate reductase [Gemella bergeri]